MGRLPCFRHTLSLIHILEYTRSGNRIRFEDKQFARRTALGTLVLAEACDYKGTFLDDIINGIYLICEETAWQLPPHNSYIRDTPSLPLPDPSRPVIDLFAAETGAVLAVAVWLLRDELRAVSPLIEKQVVRCLKAVSYTHLYPIFFHTENKITVNITQSLSADHFGRFFAATPKL